MRIKGLTPLLLNDLKAHTLNNSTVVIDGQSVFFSMYKDAKIPYAFGCESDKFANYIKTYLNKFKKSNLRCFFVFKGGRMKKIKLDYRTTHENNLLNGCNYDQSKEYYDIVMPIFTKNVWFQVLDEMGFKYVVSDGDHVTECIALALKLSCPLIGNNMQYFFSQVQYIPELNTVLDQNNNLRCGIYTLSNFLKNYYMTEEKIILFIMLTDQHILDTNIFRRFYHSNRLLSLYGNVIFTNLSEWFAQRSTEQALKEVFNVLSKSDQASFMEKKTDLENLMLTRKNSDTIMTHYVTDENKAKFTQSDPNWFEKGVFSDHIVISYINLYRYKVVNASNFIEDYDQENSIMVSIDILKYAFDLLTNFKGGAINVEYNKSSSNDESDRTFKYEHSIRKPDYESTVCVFENGWDDIKQLNLFKHFVTESLQVFDFDRLDRAPADCRLLLIALVYFSRKKTDVKLEIYSILLCYVVLGVVAEKRNKGCDRESNVQKIISDENCEFVAKPFIDSITDKHLVTATDCDVAWSLMSKYFDLRKDELCYMFNRQVLHPLVEFQRCLKELNYLNQLCGSQFDRTVYSRTYNGTFVYKILYAMKQNDCLDGFQFIKDKLAPSPTVLAFVSGIVGIYESILSDYN